MDKKIIGVGLVLTFVIALVLAAPTIIQREDITINISIEGSGDIYYNDTQRSTESFYKRMVMSDGEYRLRIPLIIDLTYLGCKTRGRDITSTGENVSVCLEEEIMDYTEDELKNISYKETREKLEEVERVQKLRDERADEAIVREGNISSGGTK